MKVFHRPSLAATRAPRVQLTVKHVVKLPNQVYKNQKRATLTTHGHGFRQPKCLAVPKFHPYCFFCYLLPRQAAGGRRSEEWSRADKRRLKKGERDRRSDDSYRGGRDKPTGSEKKTYL